MKCLTIRQPYASRIAHGDKRVENRTRQTFYRGLVFIHAGVAPHEWWNDQQLMYATFGAIVGEAVLTGTHSAHGCTREECDLYGGMFPGTVDHETQQQIPDGPLHHWMFDRATYYDEPVPATGMLGFWSPPDSIIDRLRTARLTRHEGTGR